MKRKYRRGNGHHGPRGRIVTPAGTPPSITSPVKSPGRTYGPVPRSVRDDPLPVRPLSYQDRLDRYRRQTGRRSVAANDAPIFLTLLSATDRAFALGLTPAQRRRAEHKLNHGRAAGRG